MWSVGRLSTHSGSGFPLASHVMGKLSSKGKAMSELGDWAVIVGSCSTGKQTSMHDTRQASIHNAFPKCLTCTTTVVPNLFRFLMNLHYKRFCGHLKAILLKFNVRLVFWKPCNCKTFVKLLPAFCWHYSDFKNPEILPVHWVKAQTWLFRFNIGPFGRSWSPGWEPLHCYMLSLMRNTDNDIT